MFDWMNHCELTVITIYWAAKTACLCVGSVSGQRRWNVEGDVTPVVMVTLDKTGLTENSRSVTSPPLPQESFFFFVLHGTVKPETEHVFHTLHAYTETRKASLYGSKRRREWGLESSLWNNSNHFLWRGGCASKCHGWQMSSQCLFKEFRLHGCLAAWPSGITLLKRKLNLNGEE